MYCFRGCIQTSQKNLYQITYPKLFDILITMIHLQIKSTAYIV